MHFLLYPPQTKFGGGYIGVTLSVGWSVGWLVGWLVGRCSVRSLFAQICGANYFHISWLIGLKLGICIYHEVKMCKTQFSCSPFQGLRSYLPLNFDLNVQLLYRLMKVCGANFFHISWLIGLKLGICIHHEVQVCMTKFSCPPVQALRSYLPLNFDLKRTMAI